MVIPISTTPETLRMGRGAVVNSSIAHASEVIFACTKHTGSWPAASLRSVRLGCLYSAKAVPLSQSAQTSLRQQATQEKAGLKAVWFQSTGHRKSNTDKPGSSITGQAYDATMNRRQTASMCSVNCKSEHTCQSNGLVSSTETRQKTTPNFKQE